MSTDSVIATFPGSKTTTPVLMDDPTGNSAGLAEVTKYGGTPPVMVSDAGVLA
jgi:hypothetical protein